ncbi:MAG: peptidase [Steroidobacteraceae bacterium]
MTYCLAISVEQGLVLASDSRTNAGPDRISTFSKMHRFLGDGQRAFTLLSAGNLATSQAVVTQVRRDLEQSAERSLATVPHLSDAAEYIGMLNVAETRKHKREGDSDFKPEATFVLGAEIAGRNPDIFLIYPEGNYIRASAHTPYLQAGEVKYGKPILDRIVRPDLSLEDAARCALVSMDSTMRSNATVGPPIELAICEARLMNGGRHLILDEDDEYLRALRQAWHAGLKSAFDRLPRLPAAPPKMRLVDG